jgi:hypothetical protein
MHRRTIGANVPDAECGYENQRIKVRGSENAPSPCGAEIVPQCF